MSHRGTRETFKVFKYVKPLNWLIICIFLSSAPNGLYGFMYKRVMLTFYLEYHLMKYVILQVPLLLNLDQVMTKIVTNGAKLN